MITSKYFSEKEFNRCTPSCSLQDMSQILMDKLDALREAIGLPLYLTCAYRSVAYELERSRSGFGDHPQGLGVDISCLSSDMRYLIVSTALSLGFNRVGISNRFIHLGASKNNPQRVIWMY